MNDIEETGGAKIGMAHASWPFARLSVNKTVLQLNASIIGNLYFRPSDIVSIEPAGFFSGGGIRIHHRVEKYSSKVVFLTSGSVDLINRIRACGFLDNTGPIPSDVEANIAKYQAQGSLPMKWSAVVVFIVVWNLLFLGDLFNFFNNPGSPLGNGARLAMGFAFLFVLLTLIAEPFRALVLKEGRNVKDVKAFLLFLMFLTGTGFVMTTVFLHIGK